MAFLNAGGAPTIFLEITDKAKLVRPLASAPIPIWGHNINSIESAAQINGKVEKIFLRGYHFEVCTATDRSGTGCRLDNRIDPGWNQLEAKAQTNRRGQRVDFPKKPVYLLPVWSYADNAIKMMRGGNQLFENMDAWDTQGHNIMDCDWSVWKEQKGQNKMNVEYKSQRMDSSQFTAAEITDEQKKQCVAEAMKNYTPLDDAKLFAKMNVLTVEEATKNLLEARARSNPALAGAPQQNALPPASPFSVPNQTNAMPPLALPLPAAPQVTTTAQMPNTMVQQQPTVVTAAGAVVIPPLPGYEAMWGILNDDQKRQLYAQVGVTVPVGGAPTVPLAHVAAAPSAPAVVPGFKDINPQVPVQTTTNLPGTPVPATSSPAVLSQAASTNVQVTTSVPAQTAPVVSQPVSTVTSPSSQFTGAPADYILESGKYQGKRLGDIAVADLSYLKFFRSTQPDHIKALINAVVDAKPEMPAAVAAAPAAPPPTSPAAANITAAVDERAVLVKECREIIANITEFKGAGMGSHLIPFLRQVSGANKFDYTEWDLNTLNKLKLALLTKTGGVIPGNLQNN